ncbi:HD domain-containing protein [Candidatus Micrarchaeota archaeon]|nr:HD domain-containing protein [Candidatus Micrarchaeota archaeon]
MKQYINDLKNGEFVDSLFSVKYKHPPREYTNGYMFKIGVSDKTGEVEITYWGGTNKDAITKIFRGFSENDVIHVVGIAGEYKGKLKIDINEDNGSIKITDTYEQEDFVAVTSKDIEEMYTEFKTFLEIIKDSHLKSLLDLFFEDELFVKIFKKCPGAMYMHHGYVGGLLEHTLGVAKLCDQIFKIYPSLDHDLLIAGAILHDLGKIKEFDVSTNIQISEQGMLRGHIVLGEEMLLEKINKIPGFPDILKMKLSHMILSHHGNLEYGSPKTPQFPEAAAVYFADEFDSKIFQYIKIKETAETDDFRIYTKRFGEMYLR